MMETFYSSAAVHTNGSQKIFSDDFKECVSDSPYLNGFIFECDGAVAGYAMTAHGFSTEFGARCVWIEDLYLLPEFRRRGIGERFFTFLVDLFNDCVFRLEAEEDNFPAVSLYEKRGFERLPYLEMIKHK